MALSAEAQDLIDLLDLDFGPALDVRRAALDVLQLKQRHPSDDLVHKIFADRFGYPKDLPDLNGARPPEGNTRPAGIKNSYFEQRKNGVLAEVY